MTSNANEANDTKERLLLAGMEVFAERGFADASIRAICAKAEANAAAVNYHFGDKQRFYAEVLATCHLRAVRKRPMPLHTDRPDEPELVLRAFVRWFLELLLVDGAGPLGKLMAREMADPTPALDELLRRSMLPIMVNLEQVLQALLPDLDRFQLRLVQNSILGQCLFYRHTQPAMQRFQAQAAAGRIEKDLPPMPIGDLPDFDRLARHICDFSMAGIRELQTRDPAETPIRAMEHQP